MGSRLIQPRDTKFCHDLLLNWLFLAIPHLPTAPIEGEAEAMRDVMTQKYGKAEHSPGFANPSPGFPTQGKPTTKTTAA